MWDNFPILYFTKGNIKYENGTDGLNIYVNGKCVFKMLKVKNGITMRGFRSPLAIYDDSIDPEDVECAIKPKSGSIFKYEGRKNE